MIDIFEEVEEGMRQERVQRALRQYGPLFAAAAVAILAVVAGNEVWTSLRASSAAHSSDAYQAAAAALAAGDADGAAKQFAALGKSGTGAYKALAKMQEAGAAATAGKKADAARLFDEAAGLTRDPLLSGIARLKAAYQAADTEDLPTLEKRLAPLLERGSLFESPARELLGAAALKAGDYDKAREAYTYLTVSLDARSEVARRAEEALAVINAAQNVQGTPSGAASGTAPAGHKEG
jgi:hypothetical protein